MRRLAPLPAQLVVDEIPRNGAKPRAQFFRLAQAGKLFPGGDECFLRQILALAQAAGRIVSQRADERLITRNNLAECLEVAGQAFADKAGIVVRLNGHRVCGHHIAT